MDLVESLTESASSHIVTSTSISEGTELITSTRETNVISKVVGPVGESNAVTEVVDTTIENNFTTEAVNIAVQNGAASTLVDTIDTSGRKAEDAHRTREQDSTAAVSSRIATVDCHLSSEGPTSPSVLSPGSVGSTSKKVLVREKALKVAGTAHKGYKAYGRLQRLRNGASAIAGTISSNLADYDISNDLLSESDSDADSDDKASISRNSSRSNVSNLKTKRRSRQSHGKPQLPGNAISNDEDENEGNNKGADDTYEDADCMKKQKPNGLKEGSGTVQPTRHRHSVDRRTENNSPRYDTKIGSKDSEKDKVEVTEKEVEGEEHESDDHVIEEHQQPPRKPARLLVSRARSVGHVLSWIIMILFPLLFIAVGCMSVVVAGKPSDSYVGLAVQQANNIAASVWPIAFAAIVSQSLRAFASFRAERGLKLMTLEQLINSHSLAGALKLPFVLRRLDFITVALVFLWALSPLAGQATLRMLSVDWIGNPSSGTAIYLDTFQIPHAFSDPANWMSEVDVLYMYSLIEPDSISNASADPWHNPRIPILSTLSNPTNGEYPVDNKTQNQPHTSLLGIPVGNLSGLDFIANFAINSAYFTLDCSPFKEVNLSVLYDPTSRNTTYLNGTYGAFNLGLINTTDPGASSLGYIDSIQLISSHINPSHGLSYESTICKLNRTFISSQTSGNTTGWAVTSAQEYHPTNSTPLNYSAFKACLQHLAQNDPPMNATSNTITQRYLHGGFALAGAAGQNETQLLSSLSSMDLKTFTQRFALVLNTYWHAGFAPSSQTGHIDPTQYPDIHFLPASADRIDTTLVFRSNYPWLILLFISAGILLVAGVACAIWDAQTIGPDVFGFANSMMRNGKYIKLPEGAEDAAVSGPERARLLADMEVMLQDVRPGSEVGKIVLGTKRKGDGGESRLTTGRRYR